VRVINPAAHSAAQQKDAELQQILVRGGLLPALFCVPILVKVELHHGTCPSQTAIEHHCDKHTRHA